MTPRAWGAALAYVGTIVAANVATDRLGLVPIGLGLTVTAGTFAAGLSLVLRDAVQMTAGRRATLAAIAVGVAVSALTASPGLALASGLAFAASELVDMAAFTRAARTWSPAWGVVVSTAVAAPVDTVAFLALAGFPVTLSAVVGQLVVKLAAALVTAPLVGRGEA